MGEGARAAHQPEPPGVHPGGDHAGGLGAGAGAPAQPAGGLPCKVAVRPPPPLPPGNVFFSGEGGALDAALSARLSLPLHASTSEESTLNTLRYCFHHMRCGIFVSFRAGSLRMFVPFVNAQYTNTWGGGPPTDPPALADYIAAKHSTLSGGAVGREVYLHDKTRWWANGNIVCNTEVREFWGDAFLLQLRHMLLTLGGERAVPDCEFFINKRDYPQLKADGSEPYDFIRDGSSSPLTREAYASYAPVASFFVGRAFADLPLVTTDDWEAATGLVFPPKGVDLRSAAKSAGRSVAWGDRVPTAVFRGTSTGAGVDATTNTRIRLATLGASWARHPEFGGPTPFLDVGLVGWNNRDMKLPGRPMTFIKPESLGLDVAPRVPMYEQTRFKYVL